MNYLALLVALGSAVWAWWRTRPREDTEAGRGEAERGADDGAGPTLGERVDALEVHAQGSNITHRGLREDVAHHAGRLDALEAREVPGVSGLRERVESAESLLQTHSDDIMELHELVARKITSDGGLTRRELMSLIAPVWSMLYTVQQSEPDLRETKFQGHRFLDMRVVHYLDETDRSMQEVAAQAEDEIGAKVFFDPDLRLLAVGFLDPMGAPETLAGAVRLDVDRHKWDRDIDEKSTPGDDLRGWRNE